LVNASHVKRKLAGLLCDGATTDPKQWAKRHRIENRLKQLEKKNPAAYEDLEARLIHILEAFEKAIS